MDPSDLADDVDDAGYEIDTTSTTGTSVKVITNGTRVQSYKGTDVATWLAADQELGGNGVVIEVYDADDDDTADTIVLVRTYLAKVVEVIEDDEDTKKDERALDLEIYMSGNTTDSNSVTVNKDTAGFESVYAEVEEDDYVLVAPEGDKNSDNVDMLTVALPEKVTGAVTSYTKGKNVTVAGTKYEYADSTVVDGAAYVIKDEYDLYLDANGYVLFADGVKADDQYVYVSEIVKDGVLSKSAYKGAAYFPDGTYEEITVSKIGGSDPSSDVTTGKWYTYTVKDGKYKLTALTGKAVEKATSGTITTNGAARVKYDTSNVKANKATVFVVLQDDETTVYTGINNVPDISATTGSTVAVIMGDNGYAKYAFINLTDDSTIEGATKGSDLVYIINHTDYTESVDADDNTFFTYDAIVNGKETTINVNASNVFTADALYTDVKYDSDGYVDSADVVSGSADKNNKAYSVDTAINYADGVLAIPGTRNFVLADNYTIYVVATDDSVKTMTAEKLAKNYATLKADVYTVEDDEVVSALYVDLQ